MMFEKIRGLLSNKTWAINLIISLAVLYAAFEIQRFAASIAERADTTPVHDLILDHIPTINLDPLLVALMYAILLCIFFGLASNEPERLPYFMKALALLFLLRALAINLTHLGVPPSASTDGTVDPLFSSYYYTQDLFFSGHVSSVFLASLIIRKPWLKWALTIGSVVVAIILLIMHVHYSIDILAGYFIAYGIYKISQKIFKEEVT